MCGRTACTLNPDQISRAARYRNSKGRDVNPKWKKGHADKYRPSYNKAPMSYCPVLLHAKHLENNEVCQDTKDRDEGEIDQERVITAMKWGLLPPWVKDTNQAQYKMNNARSDTILTKVSYKRPLEKGHRCVVLAEGFYEWNTTKTEKQPYFIFFKDNEADNKVIVKTEVKQEDGVSKEKLDHDNEISTSDSKTQKIVTMAGIFERRKSPDDEEDDLFTFSVITVDAHPAFGWLHHRMPAMLETEEEVRRWLDFGKVPLSDAMKLIEPKDCLSWYPVSKIVNNSRNNVPECMERIDLSKPQVTEQSSESKGMAKWLSQPSTKPKLDPFQINNNNLINQNVIKDVKIPAKGQSSPLQCQKSPSKTPKKGQKRSSVGSSVLMEGWLKKAKKDGR